MKKSNNTFLRSAAMTVLLFWGMVVAHAVNVTYSLTTHPVFGQSYDIVETASLTAGANLLDNMPQALWRGYTTYKFYSDAAMTEEITEVPSANATVYVDYEFDPPFQMSNDNKTVWNYLRNYNGGGSSHRYVYYQKSNGYIYSQKNAPDNTSTSYYYQWAFYGDGYNFHVQSNYGSGNWLVWGGSNNRLTLGNKKEISWQIYANAASNSHRPGGTVSFGVPETTSLAYLYDLGIALTTQNITSEHKFDSHNQLVAVHTGSSSQATIERNDLWWYAFFASPTTSANATTDIWHVTYRILKADGTWADDIVVQKKSSNLKPSFPTAYEKSDEYAYDYFYSDSEFQEKCAANYTMPNDQNTILYIREMAVTNTMWKTLCLPYDIDDLDYRFGVNGDESCADVWEYTSLTTTKTELGGYNFKVIFTKTDKIEANKPYLYRFVNIGEALVTEFDEGLLSLKDNEDYDEDAIIGVSQVDAAYPEMQVVMKGTFEGYELTVQESKSDPYYFYFGYNSDTETYNFYPVKKRNVTMPSFRCYFYAVGTEDNPVNFSMGMDETDGIGVIVGTVDTDATQMMGVYNLNGQLVRSIGSIEGLPAGVYVVNGKKMVVK